MPGFVDYMFVEFSANIAMFMPLGFLLVLILPRQMWWVAPATGFAASCAAEVAQALFLPNRFATIEDVISNTSGAILGAVIALAIRAVILSRRTPGSVAVVHALELMPVAT
jgi:glycopeptide antibiotics resistance protein